MKKIISFLSVFAMICTLFTNVALADENNYYSITEASKTDNVVTLQVTLVTNKNLRSASLTLDMSGAVTKGLNMETDVTVNKGADAYVANKSTSKKTIAFSVTSATGEATGNLDLGTIVIDTSNLTESFNFVISAYKAQDADRVTVTDSFTTTGVTSYTIEAPKKEESTTVDAVAGKTIENDYKTFSAPAPVTMPSSTDGEIAVTKTNSERKLTHALPNGVAGGKAKILPIVSYKLGENGVVAGDVFTITVTSGSDTIATYTYTAE